MKTLPIHFKSLAGVLAIFAMVMFVSCEDNPSGVREASGPPRLDRVSLVNKDSTTSEGSRGVQYVIWGSNLAATRSVTFNGAEANVNPALATDQNIIVTVPTDAPYTNAPDSVVVTNNKGSASLHFSIMQPPPIIDSFTPKAGGVGSTVTITGSIFEGVEHVYFGDKEAEIISSTATEIKVKVPEGVVQSKITVVTPGGETVSEASFGFKYIVYDDELNPDWYEGGYTGTFNYQNTEHVKRGTNSVRFEFSGAYGAFQTGFTGSTPLNLTDGYTAVKVSIYGETSGNVQLVLNGAYDSSVTVPLEITKGEYTDFTISLSDLGNPSQLTEIVIQNQGTTLPFVIYIDDLGLI